jgi:transposase
MSKNTYPLRFSTSVKKAAAELAANDGVSQRDLARRLGVARRSALCWQHRPSPTPCLQRFQRASRRVVMQFLEAG